MPDPVAAPAVAPTAPTTTAPAVAPATPVSPAVATWHSNFEADDRGWLANRGLTDLDATAAIPALMKTARNAEKLIGAPASEIIRMPKDDVAWDQTYSRLGRPSDPKGYALNPVEGIDGQALDWVRGTAHKLGLNDRQANTMASEIAALAKAETASRQAAKDAASIDQGVALKKAWGGALEKNTQIAKGVVQMLGVKGEEIGALQDALGYDGVMKFFHNLGTKFGEDKFLLGSSQSTLNGAMTPDAALAQLAERRADPEWCKKYAAGNAEATAEMKRLHKYAYPDET